MTPWTKKNRFAKSILAGLAGAGWAGLFATIAVAQTAVMPASLPLYFEANQGQVDSPAQFIARGRDSQFLISPGEAQLVLCKTTAQRTFSARAVRMQFVGANNLAQISGAEELSGKINYLVGNNPARWQTGVATFARVDVGQLYPGVNLAYYGNQRQLEYDFTVAPGADPGVIAIHFAGADKISINSACELVLNLGDSEIRQPKPVIYQTANGARQEIAGGYKILDAHTVAFAVGNHDRNLPLVIDPILSYSTYFGGTAGNTAAAVAVDTNGSVYVAGSTLSANLATTNGVFQTNYAGGTFTGDAFVAKFSNNGSNLVYCTYLGGSQDDFASGLALDKAGDVFLTGSTDSPNFPTNNALYPKILGHAYSSRSGTFYDSNAFVTELNTNGSRLIYSTYLGGSGNIPFGTGDTGTGIAVDSAGDAYVTGFTSSTNFPVTNSVVYQLAGTTNTLLNRLAGSFNAFLAKIGPGGSPLIYSTYLGGTNTDEATGVAVDGANCAYVTGFTDSTNFPTTNAFQTALISTNIIGGNNAFVAKFSPSGSNLVYSTFLGGTNNDQAFGIAVDSETNVYVTGGTTSPDFTNTAVNVTNLFNELTNNQNGLILTTNAFLVKLNPNGSILYSAVFGGFAEDTGYGVVVSAGEAYVVGTTSSTNFPTLNAAGLLAATNSGNDDVFVTAFNTNGTALLYSVYLGGANNDFGYGIALDPAGDAYIVGQTLSANFPTNNARQATLNGPSDAFLAKILSNLSPVPDLSAISAGTNVLVSWPAMLPFEPELPEFIKLESNTNLLSTNSWVLAPQPPVLAGTNYTYLFNPTNPVLFFRLQEF
jgi:hypothetical protein